MSADEVKQSSRVGVERIVSGGQTGADRGGLDAAIELGIPHGGWCPRGRRAPDGVIPERYQLTEMQSRYYKSRTRKNVEDSDGTVVFAPARSGPGSRFTMDVADKLGKPCLHILAADLQRDSAGQCARLREWLRDNGIRTLNVAGSRESGCPGLQSAVTEFLVSCLGRVRAQYPAEEEQIGAEIDQPLAAEPPGAPPRGKRGC